MCDCASTGMHVLPWVHEEGLCTSSLRSRGEDKPVNVCIVVANELKTKWEGREGWREKETRGERSRPVVFVPCLILLMVLRALAGKQMFCVMDSIFLSPRLDSFKHTIMPFSYTRLTGSGGQQACFKILNWYSMHVKFLMDYIMTHLYRLAVFAQTEIYFRVLTYSIKPG